MFFGGRGVYLEKNLVQGGVKKENMHCHDITIWHCLTHYFFICNAKLLMLKLLPLFDKFEFHCVCV